MKNEYIKALEPKKFLKEKKAVESLFEYFQYDDETLEIARHFYDNRKEDNLVDWFIEMPFTKEHSQELSFPLNRYKTIDDSNGNDLVMLFLDDVDDDERVLLANFEGITIWKSEQAWWDEEQDGLLHAFFYRDEE